MSFSQSADSITLKVLHGALLLLAFAAPISIAGTQAAWALALLVWLIRLIFVRPKPRFNYFDAALFAFIGLTLVSSFFSYEREVSLRKMVAVSLVTIVYLFSAYFRDRQMITRAVALLLTGCFIACIYAFGVLAVGKNLKVIHLAADSPLRTAGVEETDTILTAKGVPVSSPEDLVRIFTENAGPDGIPVVIYRYELIKTYKVSTAEPWYRDAAGFGITEWTRGRDTRASGFYGHYATFSEALQLIASLALGLLLIVPGGFVSKTRVLLGITLLVYLAALFLTVTRASWLAFLISGGVMFFAAASRRSVVIAAVLAIPLIIGGLFYLQQKRQVGFVDTNDGSTTWRMTVWREGFNLLTGSPRHLAVGIGMDSIKNHYLEWHMFDDGKLPIGHMHSTPLQIALERGVPTLLAWIVWMVFYLRMLWKAFRKKGRSWIERGVLLGAFGGTAGFLTSGLVHYNWGDSEVAMIFYLIMGLSLAIVHAGRDTTDELA